MILNERVKIKKIEITGTSLLSRRYSIIVRKAVGGSKEQLSEVLTL
jgi:hypothetical protein